VTASGCNPLTMHCAACGAEVERLDLVGRRDTCPQCAEDLRSCRNCSFYEPSLSNGCREPQAEQVADKVRSNFCDYFAPASSAGGATRTVSSGTPRADLDRLFRKR